MSSVHLSVCRIPPIISGTGKATNFKFCMHIYRLNRNKSPLKILRKVASQGLPKIFRAPIRRVHRAVIFAIAQLSCLAYIMRIYYALSCVSYRLALPESVKYWYFVCDCSAAHMKVKSAVVGFCFSFMIIKAPKLPTSLYCWFIVCKCNTYLCWRSHFSRICQSVSDGENTLT